MSKVLKNPLVWCLLLIVSLYFLSGIIDAGKVLNEIPYLGWFFWGLTILIIFYFFLLPACDFFRLPKWKDPTEFENLVEKNKCLKHYAEHLLKQFSGNRKETPSEIAQDISELKKAMAYQKPDIDRIEKHIIAIRTVFAETIAKKVIHRYMGQAALIVAISPKGWVDSITLILLQIRLIKELSLKFGYRPSMLFLICCCFWCLSNSLFAAFLGGDVSEEVVFDLMKGGVGVGIAKFMGGVGQAIYAASAVFVTGSIMRDYFLGLNKKKSMHDLLSLRMNALLESKEIIKEKLTGEAELF